jgi:hypothetical protein
VEIPTDEHLKRYVRKRPKPEKNTVVAATMERRRYRDRRQQENNDA